MNQEHSHSIQDPISEQQRPGYIPNKRRFQGPEAN